jgi:hypothetical protein
MNAEQKRAWLAIASGVACLGALVVIAIFWGIKFAPAAFGFLGVNGLGGFIGSKEKADERDLAICRKASIAGFVASYLAFCAGCMGVWVGVYAFGHRQTVSVHTVAEITMIGWGTCLWVRAIVILVLYGRHVEPSGE